MSALAVMRFGYEGLDHKLYYLHPRQTIGKAFADCTWEASSALRISKTPFLAIFLAFQWFDADLSECSDPA